jgi:hypothetical protein
MPNKVSHHIEPQKATKKETSEIDGTNDPCRARSILCRCIWTLDFVFVKADRIGIEVLT